ncbi:MAG: hypothetical protein WC845_03895 [Candidatus Staskawiczbacteria bacterium]
MPHSKKRNVPIGTIKKFLDYLQQHYPKYENFIIHLQKAREFRSNFVTHIQQYALHDWMTVSYRDIRDQKCAVVYFVRSEGGELPFFSPAQLNPYNKGFNPPVKCKSFYVSPRHVDCFVAFKSFIKEFLTDLSKE